MSWRDQAACAGQDPILFDPADNHTAPAATAQHTTEDGS